MYWGGKMYKACMYALKTNLKGGGKALKDAYL